MLQSMAFRSPLFQRTINFIIQWLKIWGRKIHNFQFFYNVYLLGLLWNVVAHIWKYKDWECRSYRISLLRRIFYGKRYIYIDIQVSITIKIFLMKNLTFNIRYQCPLTIVFSLSRFYVWADMRKHIRYM